MESIIEAIVFIFVIVIPSIVMILHLPSYFRKEEVEGIEEKNVELVQEKISSVPVSAGTGFYYEEEIDSYDPWEEFDEVEEVGDVEEEVDYYDLNEECHDTNFGFQEDHVFHEPEAGLHSFHPHPELELQQNTSIYDRPGENIQIDIDYFGIVDNPLEMVDDYSMDHYDDYGSMDYGFDSDWDNY